MKDYNRLRLLAKALARRPGVDLKVIHLIRDVRGVVSSLMRTSPSTEAKRYAKYWVRSHVNTDRIRRCYLHSSQYLRVHYDELCRDPAAEMGRIAEFLGVETNFDLAKINPANYHILGNVMRHKPIQAIAEDDRWSKELTEKNLTAISRVAGRVAKSYCVVSSGGLPSN